MFNSGAIAPDFSSTYHPHNRQAIGRQRFTVSHGASCVVPDQEPNQRAFPSEQAHELRQQLRLTIGVNGGGSRDLVAAPNFLARTVAQSAKPATEESAKA
jgi:hypothetical protein